MPREKRRCLRNPAVRPYSPRRPPCARFCRTSRFSERQLQILFRHFKSGSTVGPRCPVVRVFAFSGWASSRVFCVSHNSFAEACCDHGSWIFGRMIGADGGNAY